MKLKKMGIYMASVLFAAGLTGCKSDAARERQAQEDRALQEVPLSAEEQALVQREQERLDGVEQWRTGNAAAHSCRKAKEVYASSNTKIVDTNGCSVDQLKLEQDAEQRQAHDKMLTERMQKMDEMRKRVQPYMKPFKGRDSADQ